MTHIYIQTKNDTLTMFSMFSHFYIFYIFCVTSIIVNKVVDVRGMCVRPEAKCMHINTLYISCLFYDFTYICMYARNDVFFIFIFIILYKGICVYVSIYVCIYAQI